MSKDCCDCSDDDFDICTKDYDAGKRCYQPESHTLRLRFIGKGMRSFEELRPWVAERKLPNERMTTIMEAEREREGEVEDQKSEEVKEGMEERREDDVGGIDVVRINGVHGGERDGDGDEVEVDAERERGMSDQTEADEEPGQDHGPSIRVLDI